MIPAAEQRRQRAAARQSWPLRRYALGEEPGDDLADSTTAQQRLAMIDELSVQAWQLSGRELPAYSRQTMPGKLVRRAR